jgi:hypothetical protein
MFYLSIISNVYVLWEIGVICFIAIAMQLQTVNNLLIRNKHRETIIDEIKLNLKEPVFRDI